jgi:hypothetical protein
MNAFRRFVGVPALALALLGGCSTGPIKDEKREGSYLIIADLPDVSIADVGYKGVAPNVRTIANDDWAINGTVGSGVEQVIGDRVSGKALYVDDKEVLGRLSYEKILILRKLDADDAEFIRNKYAANSPDYLVLITKYRFGMSEFYGAGMRQKDIPMADFRCQFFAALQLEVYELSTGKILSTLTESQREDCPVSKYFDDVNSIGEKEQVDIKHGVQHIAAKAANRIARHLLMTDAEKDEFKLRLPGFE